MRSPSLALLFLVVSVVAGGATANGFTLADTECVWCTDLGGAYTPCPQAGEPYYGQDAQYTGAALSLQNNGDDTVSDLNTGLVWQQLLDTTYRTYEDASAYCQLLPLAGRSWRVPSMWELITIAPYGYASTIDTFFPNMNEALAGGSGAMWSSTVNNVLSYGSYNTYDVMKSTGESTFYDEREALVTMCVSGDSIPYENYTDNGDGTVSHAGTGLMWEKTTSTDSMNWGAALAYCEAQTTGGHTDWRLPNTRELQYVLDYDSSASPTFPGVFDGKSDNYWASSMAYTYTPYPPAMGDLASTNVRSVYTRTGYARMVPNANDTQKMYAMCVRTLGGNTSSPSTAAMNILLLD